MSTTGEGISRVRNVLKTVKEDPFMTDRFIYSLIMKHARTLMHRDTKRINQFKNSTLFKELPCVELKDVDRVSACCTGITTGCTFKRSVDRLPAITDVDNGPMIRAVTTLDYSQQVHKTHPSLYTNMTKTSGFKYNTKKYYWINDGYLFIPEVDWESVRIQAMFEEDLSPLLCNIGDKTICVPEQEREMNIPEHLFSEIESMVHQELLIAGQIPSDGPDDGQNILR